MVVYSLCIISLHLYNYRSSLKPLYMLHNNTVLCMLHICQFLIWNLLSENFDPPSPQINFFSSTFGGFPSGLSIIILLKDPGFNFNLRTLSSNPLWSYAQFIVVLMTANCPVPEAEGSLIGATHLLLTAAEQLHLRCAFRSLGLCLLVNWQTIALLKPFTDEKGFFGHLSYAGQFFCTLQQL